MQMAYRSQTKLYFSNLGGRVLLNAVADLRFCFCEDEGPKGISLGAEMELFSSTNSEVVCGQSQLYFGRAWNKWMKISSNTTKEDQTTSNLTCTNAVCKPVRPVNRENSVSLNFIQITPVYLYFLTKSKPPPTLERFYRLSWIVCCLAGPGTL